MSDWQLNYRGFDPAQQGLRETLCTLGNGYFATRGALPECAADQVHYPATYIAGTYNRLTSHIAGRSIENEDLVNVPNWLSLTFRHPDRSPFDPQHTEVIHHQFDLDLRRAVLSRQTRYRDEQGRMLRVTQRRFVSLRDPHHAALETTLVAENWSGPLTLQSAIDGTVLNAGVQRYRDLANDHLEMVSAHQATPDTICLLVQTSQSRIAVAEAVRTRLYGTGTDMPEERAYVEHDRFVAHRLDVEMRQGAEVTIEKIATIFTSRDAGISEPSIDASNWAAVAPGFDTLLDRHLVSWRHAWNRSEIAIGDGENKTGRVLNLHIFHLLQTVSKNTVETDAGVPARGLHGEAYRGHIFWDELFILPFLNLRVPELTRALLRYRYRRLDQARYAASLAGLSGAMYPWQSGSSGREETQRYHLNPDSGRWLPDASHLQRHINSAIAYNIWHYYQATADSEFLRFWGGEIILEIARFWASISTYNRTIDRYEILAVMGPDEYHDAYPGADTPGVDNNAYTNLMAAWVLARALDTLEALPHRRAEELKEKLGVSAEELNRWDHVRRRIKVPFHDQGIISQFDGYEDLDEFDWLSYTERYGDISRLDRILEAEGDSTNRYKVAKQADVVMLFYLLSPNDLDELMMTLGYEWGADLMERNIDYYEERTAHGSTLSRVVHAWIHSRTDCERAWEHFKDALVADVADVQGGTTREGIHLGAMAGTVDLVQRCFAGIDTRADMLFIDPRLPAEVSHLSFDIQFRGCQIHLDYLDDEVSLRMDEGLSPVSVNVSGVAQELAPGCSLRFGL